MTALPGVATTPYRLLLGQAYDRLHPQVRIAHEAPLRATGHVDVVHGSHPMTPFLVRAMRLPAAGLGKPVTLEVRTGPASVDDGRSMLWMRQIGATRLDTCQFAGSGLLIERSGPGTVLFSLREDGGALMYEAAGCRFMRCGIPHWCAPAVHARVAPSGEGWQVEVTITWHAHLICRYGGSMNVARPAAV